ncbi:MAG: hypothetical protein ACI91B_005145 [Planctomycetota bacterium]
MGLTRGADVDRGMQGRHQDFSRCMVAVRHRLWLTVAAARVCGANCDQTSCSTLSSFDT